MLPPSLAVDAVSRYSRSGRPEASNTRIAITPVAAGGSPPSEFDQLVRAAASGDRVGDLGRRGQLPTTSTRTAIACRDAPRSGLGHNSTGGSVLLVVLLHGAQNATNGMVRRLFDGAAQSQSLTTYYVVSAVTFGALKAVIAVLTRGRLGLTSSSGADRAGSTA